MPAVSKKTLVATFRALGYEGLFSGGKHQFMIKGTKKIRIPNPHGTGDIDISLVREILRQAEISAAEWEKA